MEVKNRTTMKSILKHSEHCLMCTLIALWFKKCLLYASIMYCMRTCKTQEVYMSYVTFYFSFRTLKPCNIEKEQRIIEQFIWDFIGCCLCSLILYIFVRLHLESQQFKLQEWSMATEHSWDQDITCSLLLCHFWSGVANQLCCWICQSRGSV